MGNMMNPFAPKAASAPPPPKLTAEQQTIKVEVGEELHEERRKAKRFSVITGLLAAVLGLGIGFVAGGSKERKDRVDQGIKGAGLLETDVAEATKRIEDLVPIMRDIDESLRAKKFPTESVDKLASFAVPFNAATLENKAVGSLPAGLQSKVLSFLRKSVELQDAKEALQGELNAKKPALEAIWKKQEKPVFELGVVFGGGDPKFLTQVVALKDPFETATKDWPKEITIKVPGAQGKIEEKKANRYDKDTKELNGSVILPIDPSSVAGFTDQRATDNVYRLMEDIRVLWVGVDVQGRERPGLKKEGEELVAELEKLSLRR